MLHIEFGQWDRSRWSRAQGRERKKKGSTFLILADKISATEQYLVARYGSSLSLQTFANDTRGSLAVFDTSYVEGKGACSSEL